jgi:hypothetical protein
MRVLEEERMAQVHCTSFGHVSGFFAYIELVCAGWLAKTATQSFNVFIVSSQGSGMITLIKKAQKRVCKSSYNSAQLLNPRRTPYKDLGYHIHMTTQHEFCFLACCRD